MSFTPGGNALGMGQRKQSADRRKPRRGNGGCGGLQGGEKLERSDGRIEFLEFTMKCN